MSAALEDRGLYRKYSVTRRSDPTGKHDQCEYFVLDPAHDPMAYMALRWYARLAERTEEYRELASDLHALCDRSRDALTGATPTNVTESPSFAAHADDALGLGL